MKKVRCAIYTRKSSEEGLEQEFNSLHAQREACAAYVASQKHEGWILLPEQYDDGGLSGGSLERPALQRLLEDARSGTVDQIVVYKIDRLTRSLADFSKIVDILDAADASFVSVMQSFNTATSMGRLTLNMLLSFAQFEREVTAERIRDKIAASKRKGLWMGGQVPLGYDADGRTLSINSTEVRTIRTLYDLYKQLGTIRQVKHEADRLGLRSRQRTASDGTTSGGNLFDRGHIHHILTNPIYAGRIRHRDKVFDGQHDAIIEPKRWDAIQKKLQASAAKGRGRSIGRATQSPLTGKLFDETGDRLTPSHSRTRKGVRLRYYISHRLVARSGEPHPDAWRLPAQELEGRIAGLVRTKLAKPGFLTALFREASADQICRIATRLGELDKVGDADRLAIIERIDLAPGNLTIRMDAKVIAERLQVDPSQLSDSSLVTGHPFQLRKRGVETRIILADESTCRDVALLLNIARALHWFERIKTGETFAEIAKTEGTSKRRVQQMIGLAFLAPDIITDVINSKQPIGFTSDWCLRHDLPSDWAEQRALLATL